jgi:hypothetical protein
MPSSPPTYRERLRVEGGVLAGCGAAGSIALLATTDEAARMPLNTLGQLAVVAGMLRWLGPRSVRRALAAARPVAPGEDVSGEPTPLWQLPLVVGVLATAVAAPRALHTAMASRAGFDAGLRVTAGCLLVGLAQALLLERIVAAEERRAGGRFVRLLGSRIMRGTKLGLLRDERV